MSTKRLPIFKNWVPDYLIRITIFLIMFPALAVFAFYYSNTLETVSYYGIEPTDVQYSVILMYGALVCFLPLDDRFVKYFTVKQYLLLGAAVNTITYIICAQTRDLTIFFICRFIQGAMCALFCSICLNLIFPRLHSLRARVMGYTIFYGTLLISVPVCGIICSYILQYYSFNVLFYVLIVSQLPGVVLLLITTNNVQLRDRLPLYQIDWVSYTFFTVIICSIGYVFVYGQQLNWLDSSLIISLIAIVICAIVLFVWRQLSLKRPFINMSLFKYKDFRYGIVLLMIYYFFKGTSSFAYAYLQGPLGVPPISLTPIYLSNFLGTIVGMVVASRFLLNGTVIKNILIVGFIVLLIFHIQVYFLFSRTASTEDFIIPFFLQGASISGLLVPLVVYTAASIPPAISNAVSFLGISFRFISFSITIGITNYFQLFNKSTHYNRFGQTLTELDPTVNTSMNAIHQNVIMDGKNLSTVNTATSQMFNKIIGEQVATRAALDYFTWAIYALIVLILVLIIISPTKRFISDLSKKFIPY